MDIFLQAVWQWHSPGLFLQHGNYTGTRLPLNRVSNCEMRVGNISKNNRGIRCKIQSYGSPISK